MNNFRGEKPFCPACLALSRHSYLRFTHPYLMIVASAGVSFLNRILLEGKSEYQRTLQNGEIITLRMDDFQEYILQREITQQQTYFEKHGRFQRGHVKRGRVHMQWLFRSIFWSRLIIHEIYESNQGDDDMDLQEMTLSRHVFSYLAKKEEFARKMAGKKANDIVFAPFLKKPPEWFQRLEYWHDQRAKEVANGDPFLNLE